MEKPSYASDTLGRYIVRFPDGMRERLKVCAQSNNRTLNAEIVARLAETLDGPAARELSVGEIVEALAKGHAHTLPDGGVTIKIEVTSNSKEKIFPTRQAYDEGMSRLDKADAERSASTVSGGTKRGRSQKAS